MDCGREALVSFPPSYLIWAGKLPSSIFGAFVRPPGLVGQTGVAKFPRICIQGPSGSTNIWPLACNTRDRGGGARANFITQSRDGVPAPSLSRDHSTNLADRNAPRRRALRIAKQPCPRFKSIFLLISRPTLGLLIFRSVSDPICTRKHDCKSQAHTRKQRHRKGH